MSLLKLIEDFVAGAVIVSTLVVLGVGLYLMSYPIILGWTIFVLGSYLVGDSVMHYIYTNINEEEQE